MTSEASWQEYYLWSKCLISNTWSCYANFSGVTGLTPEKLEETFNLPNTPSPTPSPSQNSDMT